MGKKTKMCDWRQDGGFTPREIVFYMYVQEFGPRANRREEGIPPNRQVKEYIKFCIVPTLKSLFPGSPWRTSAVHQQLKWGTSCQPIEEIADSHLSVWVYATNAAVKAGALSRKIQSELMRPTVKE